MITLYRCKRTHNLRLESDDGSYINFKCLSDLFCENSYTFRIGISAKDLPDQFYTMGTYQDSFDLFNNARKDYPEEFI